VYTFANMIEGYPSLDQAATRIRQAIDKRKGWVFFHGPSGIGKTYLMTAGANYAADLGMSVYFGHTSTIMDDLHAAVMGTHEQGMTYPALKRLLVECDLLVLDEFGDFHVTAWKRDRIKEILEYRANPVWRTTLIAANKTGREIEKMFPWLADRLNQRNMVYETSLPGVPTFRGRIE
jgi:DNA replication protein DnaC